MVTKSVTEVETYVLKYADTPPSMNTNVGKGHWRKFHQEKKKWEGIFAMLCLKERVPKGCTVVHAKVWLRFRVNRRRDPGNFRTIIEKALGDALQAVGVIPDDTAAHFEVQAVELAEVSGPASTAITLEVWR